MIFPFAILFLPALLQDTPSEIIQDKSMQSTLEILAGDAMEGRRTGSKGIRKAREYLIGKCKEENWEPLGETYELSWGIGANVGAFLPGKTRDEIILVCAHYDHLGKAWDSRKKVGKDDIFNGADDNASGTTALLFLGEALARINPDRKRSVLLLWTAGEEQGRNGAKSFCQKPPVPLSKIVAVVNIDMIGRKTPEGVQLFGVNFSAAFQSAAEIAAKAVPEARVQIRNKRGNYYHRTDTVVFYSRGIPGVFLFAGMHPDYHRVTDHADRIEYRQLAVLTRYLYHLIVALANHPDKIKFRR